MFKVITYLLLIFQIIHQKVLAKPTKCNQDLILTAAKHQLKLKVAITTKEKNQGLSGTKNLNNNHGMFFYYPKSRKLSFWMPDTYIDLDIFFINKNLKVIAVARKMKAHPGRQIFPAIMQTKAYYARYVLELKSVDPISKMIKENDQLKFLCSNYFLQTKQGIHLKK